MITKEKFIQIMSTIKETAEKCDKVDEALGAVYQYSDVYTYDMLGGYEKIIIDLIVDGLPANAKSDIEFWMYELNYGEDYRQGLITNADDDQEIPMQTVEDLWNAIWMG